MPRYKLTIEYDGNALRRLADPEGFAHRAGRAGGSAVERFSGEAAHVSGAGRTDAGSTPPARWPISTYLRPWRTDQVRDAMTAHLRPHPVAVVTVELVPDDFDARFSAVKRHYLYRIVNRRPDLALDRDRAWRIPQSSMRRHA